MVVDVTHGALITGAAGTLGRRVAHGLSRLGIDIVGMGRSAPPPWWSHRWITGDMTEPGALRAAVRDVDTVVNCATDPETPERDSKMLGGLVDVCESFGLHLVHVSVAGIDAAGSSPYYAAKLEGERLLRCSGLRYTLVRSTQFHPFVLSMLRRLEFGPFLLCPPLGFQPVDPCYVADVIGRCVMQRAVVTTVLSGPERPSFRQLAAAWLDERQVHRLRLSIPAAGPLAPMASLMPVGGSGGGSTWAAWLRQRRCARSSSVLSR